MSRRGTWVVGVVVLLAIAGLLACRGTYMPAYDGLVIVPSFGSAAMQVFSLDLTTGRTATIDSAPTISGQPTAMVLDPTGTFAYVTIVPNAQVFQSVAAPSIAAYKIASDGTLSEAVTSLTMLSLAGAGTISPVAMTIDSAGKFLFVADQLTANTLGNTVPGSISVFSIGSGGSLAEVAGSPFTVQPIQNGITANLVGLAVTPTKYPVLNTQSVQNAECSLVQPLPPSTPEYLYVADANNNVVWAFNVQSGGILSPIVNPLSGVVVTFPADSVTTGVAVDPCNRFVFVTNNNSNDVSAYAICNGTSPARPPICVANQYPAGYLVEVPGSPFSLGGGTTPANGPTVLAVDPLANFVYVVNNKSNTLSGFRISQTSGGLAPTSPAVVNTGINPTAIAIRGDDNWLFVANNDTLNGFGVLSQYELTPASGTLTPFGTGIQTDNYPTAVGVK